MPLTYVLPPKSHFVKRFEDTKSHPAYKSMSDRMRVIGVWDDHDYGKNDAGRIFEGKEISR